MSFNAEALPLYTAALSALHPLGQVSHLAAALHVGPPKPDLNEAIRHYTAAVALRPDGAAIHRNLGVVLLKAGNLADAEGSIRKAIELKPDFADAHGNLAAVGVARGRLDDAAAAAGEATRLAPRRPNFFEQLGGIHLKRGDLPEAAKAYRTLTELAPRYSEGHFSLGYALERMDPAKAMAAYRQAAAIDNHGKAWNNIGNLLLDADRPDEADDAFRNAIKANPADPFPRFSLGNLRWLQNRFAEALVEFRAAVRLDPKYALAHYGLGRTLHRLGKFEEAAGSLRTAIRLDPNHADAHGELGLVLHRGEGLGFAFDPQAAKTHLETALRLSPTSAVALVNLGNVYMGLGRFTEAAELHRRGLALHTWGKETAFSRAMRAQDERVLGLERRLPALLAEDERPADVAECPLVANLCDFRRDWANAARFYGKTFAMDPGHQKSLQMAAGLSAARAAFLQVGLPEAKRQELRRLALGWLRGALGDLSGYLDARGVDDRLRAEGRNLTLGVGPLREHARVDGLRREERERWDLLFADIDRLRRRLR